MKTADGVEIEVGMTVYTPERKTHEVVELGPNGQSVLLSHGSRDLWHHADCVLATLQGVAEYHVMQAKNEVAYAEYILVCARKKLTDALAAQES